MTLVTTRRTAAEQDVLVAWLEREADDRPGSQGDMLHRIANMIRPRSPEQIAREAYLRADAGCAFPCSVCDAEHCGR